MEIWKPVKGFEDYYEISSEGRIRSTRFNRIIKTYPTYRKGGLVGRRACFTIDGVHYRTMLSRVLYSAFIRELEDHEILYYKDGNPANCTLENLEIKPITSISKEDLSVMCETMTARQIAEKFDVPVENMRQKIANAGLSAQPASRWPDEIDNIRELYKTHTQEEIAKIYGVEQSRISDVMNRYGIETPKYIEWWREIDNIRKLARKHTKKEIAEFYNVDVGSIYQVFRRYDIEETA